MSIFRHDRYISLFLIIAISLIQILVYYIKSTLLDFKPKFIHTIKYYTIENIVGIPLNVTDIIDDYHILFL